MEGVLELHKLCGLAQSFLPEQETGAAGMAAGGPDAFRARWSAFADVLEVKRLAIHVRSAGRVMELLQEPAILERLAQDSEVAQSELAALVKLSPGRISQVLGVLEARGKVTRVKRGKENWVSLAAGEPAAPEQKRVAPQPVVAVPERPGGYGRNFLAPPMMKAA